MKEPQAIVDMEERSWLQRHCQGDERAFPALLQAYRRPVYSYLLRNGVAREDLDDLFQTVFLKIHAAAASYDPARPLRPWLFTIVANSLRNHFRDLSAGRSRTAESEEALDPPDPNPGPEHIAEVRERLSWLQEALLRLPPDQREALLLVTCSGLSQEEAADALGLPLNTLKTKLRRARLALAEDLARRDKPREFTGGRDDKL